ncbi:MAG: cupin domain-containing protein [Sedimenticola sp.]
MKLNFQEGIDSKRFLSDYWQQKPLLIRQGFPDYHPPLTAEELAGLSCDEDIESRIVLEKDGVRPWEARNGPFDESAFASLPETHWTLLVQDVDKHIPEVADLLDPFRFLPDWRLDDIMISYAADQGSVGPHIDDYDVFLVQVRGKRRWMIHTNEVSDEDYIPGLDLRILPEFEAEFDWVMEPGDVLYLPPNVAHWGIAQGNDCMTCSVGFRAPTFQEMAAAWCDDLVSTKVPSSRYRDGEIGLQESSAEITPQALARVRRQLNSYLLSTPQEQDRWFGRFITESKIHLQVSPRSESNSVETVIALFESSGLLYRNGWSRFAYIEGNDQCDYLFANGEEYSLAKSCAGFMQWVTGSRLLSYDDAQPWLKNKDCLNLLTALFNDGHLLLEQDLDEY